MMDLVHKATNSFKKVILIYFVALSLFAGVFAYVEDKPYFDSVWWASATAMTVGYGDIVPTTYVGKTIAIVLMHGVPLVIVPLIIVRLTAHLIENQNEFNHEEQEQLKAGMEEIKSLLLKPKIYDRV